MNFVNLQQWIQHPELLNRDTLYELRMLVLRYPYFQTIRLLYLKNLYLLHDITFGAELRKAALYVGDRRILFYFIEGDKYALQVHKSKHALGNQLLEEPSLDRTLCLIDAFLSTVPEELSQSSELDYSTDYTAYLLQGSTSEDTIFLSKLRGQELIDGFLEKSENENSSFRVYVPQDEDVESSLENRMLPTIGNIPPEEEEDESYFTETLAKIYIKQQRYDKALEIIKKLNLKIPKKNAYFADQIRFLEKLIINAKSK